MANKHSYTVLMILSDSRRLMPAERVYKVVYVAADSRRKALAKANGRNGYFSALRAQQYLGEGSDAWAIEAANAAAKLSPLQPGEVGGERP